MLIIERIKEKIPYIFCSIYIIKLYALKYTTVQYAIHVSMLK